MSSDTGREGIDEKRPLRRTVERLIPAAKPGQAGELSAPSPSPESADQSTPRVSDGSRGLKEIEQAPRGVPALPAWLRRLGYYGLALFFVAVAGLLRWAFPEVLSPTPFLVFYLALVGAAAFGGLGPGLVATIVSWVCVDFLFDPTPGHIGFDNPMSVARLLVFLAGGLVISVVGEKMRRSRIGERWQGRELAQLARSLEREQGILQAIMDGAKNSHLVYLDRDFNFVRVNETYARTCGYAPEEMIGKNHFVLYPYAENEAIFSRVRDTGVPVEFHDKPFVFPDQPQRGTTYWDWTLTPVKSDSGRVEGLVFSLFETTQRRQAQDALRESEEKYRRIVETATEAIVMADADGRLLFVNDHWSKIFGYSPEEARRLTLFDQVFPEDLAEMSARWESRKHGRKETYEFRLRRKDGRPVWVLIGVTPRFDPAGKFLGTLVLAADITERRRMEEALREWNATLETKVAQRTAELEQRARQLQKLTLDLSQAEERERKRLAEILHDDLQQVLAAAKFHLSVLHGRVKDDAGAQEIAAQVKDLLGDAIGKSRSLSHELSSPALAQGDVARAFESLVEQMQAQHGLTVRLDLCERVEIPSEPLRVLLCRAAQELLFNVVKHAGVREARLRLRRGRGRIRLSISDRGRGFDPRELGKAGGFGLRSVRERTELLGGRMKIRSTKGKGSIFLLAVPDADTWQPAPP